jgi:hypothetical protein
MRFVILAAAILAATSAGAAPAHHVRGYVTENGTYVAPHYQTNPNNTRVDNYSSQGNVNPYTGQAGSVNPYGAPANPYAADLNPWNEPKPR